MVTKEPDMSVNKDSNVEGGLFSHYDAALEAGQPALKVVASTPSKQMDAPMRARDCGPRQAIAAAAIAAGTVRLLGDAVETYNQQVDELNATWRAAKADNFGVAPMDVAGDSSDWHVRRLARDHADQLLDAKLELLSRLEREHGDYRGSLDAEIVAATQRLSAGPTAKAIMELVAAGGLPAALVPALPIDDGPIRAS
jgi:hypothetical protein